MNISPKRYTIIPKSIIHFFSIIPFIILLGIIISFISPDLIPIVLQESLFSFYALGSTCLLYFGSKNFHLYISNEGITPKVPSLRTYTVPWSQYDVIKITDDCIYLENNFSASIPAKRFLKLYLSKVGKDNFNEFTHFYKDKLSTKA